MKQTVLIDDIRIGYVRTERWFEPPYYVRAGWPEVSGRSLVLNAAQQMEWRFTAELTPEESALLDELLARITRRVTAESPINASGA